MPFAAVVRFWIRPDGAGYERVWLTTSHFGWHLSDRQFEEVHGLSRVVNLFPNQLTNAKYLRATGDYDEANRCISFLLRLIRFYRSLLEQHQEEPRDESDAVFDLELNSDECEILDSTRGLTLQETFNLLEGSLQVLFSVDSQEAFLNAALDLISLADWVRVAANIYLLFAHPLLTWSRRPDVQFQDPDQLEQRARTILTWAQHNVHYLASLWNAN